jgi:lipoyl(octanoyl) transferase
MSVLPVIDLGRLAYAPALERQRELHAKVVAGEAEPTVLLVEHDPVITISRRKTASQHLLASREQLAALGIDVRETDRGGDVTYHGPGQLVVYPVVRLAPLGVHIAGYMRLLEKIVIEAVAPFGVVGLRDGCATGVWVEMKPRIEEPRSNLSSSPAPSSLACATASPPSSNPTAKLAALGVRLSRGVTLHGLALNVTTDLTHFTTIVPCGLLNRAVTSLRQVLGDASPSMAQVKVQMIRSLRANIQGAVPDTTLINR